MPDSTDNNFIKFQRNFFRDRSVNYENTSSYFHDHVKNNRNNSNNSIINREADDETNRTDEDEDENNLIPVDSENSIINSIPEKLNKLSRKFKRKDSVTSLFSRKPSIGFNSSDSSVSTLTFSSISSINSSNKETNSWSNNNQNFSPNSNNIGYNNNNNNSNSNLLIPRKLRANSSPQTSISRKTSLSIKNLGNINNNSINSEVFEKIEQQQLIEHSSNSIPNDISEEYLNRNNPHLPSFRSPSTINSGKFEKFPDYDDNFSISSFDEHLKLQLLDNQEESSISGWSLQNGLFVTNNDHDHDNGNGTYNNGMNGIQPNIHSREDELSDLIAQDVLNRLGQ